MSRVRGSLNATISAKKTHQVSFVSAPFLKKTTTHLGQLRESTGP